jgi:hypothetical protein
VNSRIGTGAVETATGIATATATATGCNSEDDSRVEYDVGCAVRHDLKMLKVMSLRCNSLAT